VRVGGVLFVLDQDTIIKFGSHILTLLLDQHSPFQQPLDGIYKVDEADAESFSVFLHLAPYRTLRRYCLHNTATICREADFWGIESKVEAALRRSEEECLVFCKALGWGLLPDDRRDTGRSRSLHRKEDKIQCTECGRRDVVCPYCQRSLTHKTDFMCNSCRHACCNRLTALAFSYSSWC
jgi:hypothetical protein